MLISNGPDVSLGFWNRAAQTIRVLALGGCLVGGFLLSGSPASSNVFVVNSNADVPENNVGDGSCTTGNLIVVSTVPLVLAAECTLRAALEEANGNAGLDTIEFSSVLPTISGVVEFTPATALPAIFDPVLIDGYSHPSYDLADPGSSPIINLRGASAPAGSPGLLFLPGSDGSTARGLAISAFSGVGIWISSFFSAGPQNITLQGNHVGVWRGIFYTSGNGEDGIRVDGSDNNLIGQNCTPFLGCSGKRNVISANGQHGVSINADGTRVAGNYIGVDRSGTQTFVPFGGSTSNGEHGVYVAPGAQGNTIGSTGGIFTPPAGSTPVAAGNLISGNAFSGIAIDGAANFVYANSIGTNVSGTGALANQGSGISVGADDNVIGGSGLRGNLISGNATSGVYVDSDFGSDPFRLTIVNNRIGVNATVDAALGNGVHGLLLWGGDHTIEDNIIGGNAVHGISDTGNNSVIASNYIGTNASGADLGNGSAGLRMSEGNQLIGGAGNGNTIGFNADGIIGGGSSYNNRIVGNYIGTDAAGNDIGNLGAGVTIDAPGYEVGDLDGRTNGLANVIGFNGGDGVVDNGFDTSIQGNYIGTNGAGHALGNVGAGIRAETISGPAAGIGATLATAPGDIAGAGNTVAFNAEGIVVNATTDIPVRGNQLFSNGAPGIDLEGDGVTNNDSSDPDAGANNLQNTPVFSTAQTFYDAGTGDLEIRYGVSSTLANAAYPLSIDFYIHDPWLDPGDQARHHVGTATYGSGSAGTFVTTTLTPPAGTMDPNIYGDVFGGLRATATDANGNTSELSVQPVPVPEPGAAALLGSGLLGLAFLAGSRARGVARAVA